MNDRIANAFRCPAALTDDDLAVFVALWKKDAKAANARRSRTERTGGTDGSELARNEAYRRRRAELRKQKLAAE
ncbi:hypothetical protein GGR95_003740 [Sulfitobacter undariae]|uniref:Uncharacterized protein n=1 Tax=Sulfitobacter undariae TaxID=1563671 RepID=A0A7W6EE17_9RHOB|nr:hypothetical protein [Sulfitobacter undariae]MBB3996074.1 hypothetical protein [Sulfitobacter undariae]